MKTSMRVTKEAATKISKLKKSAKMHTEDILILDYLSLNFFTDVAKKVEGEKEVFAVNRSKILENILNELEGFSYSAKSNYLILNSERDHKKTTVKVSRDSYTEIKDAAKEVGISTKLFIILITERYTEIQLDNFNNNKRQFEKYLAEKFEKKNSFKLTILTSVDNSVWIRRLDNRVLDAAFKAYKSYPYRFKEIEELKRLNK